MPLTLKPEFKRIFNLIEPGEKQFEEREIRGVLRCWGVGLVHTIYVLRGRTACIEKIFLFSDKKKYILEDLEKINL